MPRERAQQLVVALATLACCAAIVRAYSIRGAPYFRKPETVIDHVIDSEHHLRPAVLLLREVAPALPTGAKVACVRPVKGAITDETDYFLTAVGLLPRNKVRPPSAVRASEVDYVISVGEPIVLPGYEMLHQSQNGFLYIRTP
ncbi:MAG: hypothetical protein JJE51_13915 [Thermoanaerobaculia bacterium]|nr:hypothetical protein [Thermoanaerobaculia bacterium]